MVVGLFSLSSLESNFEQTPCNKNEWVWYLSFPSPKEHILHFYNDDNDLPLVVELVCLFFVCFPVTG